MLTYGGVEVQVISIVYGRVWLVSSCRLYTYRPPRPTTELSLLCSLDRRLGHKNHYSCRWSNVGQTALKFFSQILPYLCCTPSSVAQQPKSCPGRLTVKVSRSHTHSIGLLWTSDQLIAEAATYKTTTNTRDEHAYPQEGFEPATPQSSGIRLTPYTAWPLGWATSSVTYDKFNRNRYKGFGDKTRGEGFKSPFHALRMRVNG
jgi:hypothetical protein